MLTLRGILERLRNTYCRSIGVQFMHIDDLSRARVAAGPDGGDARTACTLTRARAAADPHAADRRGDLRGVHPARDYVGAKSFSLEGAESLIPLLDLAIEKAGEQGVGEIVLGMAHRGRLNVLANIIGKSPQEIFREFEDVDPQAAPAAAAT